MVSERGGQAGGAAVHHAGVYEGGDGVELLPVALRQNSSTAAGSRAEKRHAALDTVARIRQRNLGDESFMFNTVAVGKTILSRWVRVEQMDLAETDFIFNRKKNKCPNAI